MPSKAPGVTDRPHPPKQLGSHEAVLCLPGLYEVSRVVLRVFSSEKPASQIELWHR